jgi:hypothetical protein
VVSSILFVVMLREGGASSSRCALAPPTALGYWIIRFRG